MREVAGVLLRDKGGVVFYGPPGTGKTYIAQHLATHLAGLNVKRIIDLISVG